MMQRLTQIALMGVVVLAVASLAAAQQAAQPVTRLGNYIEVGNDVWMHILATTDLRFQAVQNFDFEGRVRDAVASRNPQDTREQTGDFDGFWALLRFGVDFRYQKSLTINLTAEERLNVDGNITDARSNSTNPGGVDVFGRGASTENNMLHFNRAWLDYKFQGTPLRIRVGWDLWRVDQAGTVGDNDPRFAVFGDFGNIDVLAAAVVQYESARLGLENDNNLWYYTFSAGYNLKPHRFQMDVVYYRDRFLGADTQLSTRAIAFPTGWQGQKTDSVLLMGSWTGVVGPLRGLLQGGLVTGTARGGTTGLPVGVAPGKHYDLLAGNVIAYGEVDLGLVRPFVVGLFATGDGDPTDNKLHGFTPLAWTDISLMTDTPWFAHLDTSNIFSRDYSCPARVQGLGTNPGALGAANPTNPGAPGLVRSPANVGIAALGGTPGRRFSECSHTVGNPFNDQLASTSHLGILTTYGNPGTLLGMAGLRVFPRKGHDLTGWYAYRGWVNSKAFNIAFAPERASRGLGGIRTGEYHEIGGSWLWTLNPNFDIRLAGNIAIPAGGYRDLAALAVCNPGGLTPAGGYVASTPCRGTDPALHGEARFRARF